MYLRRLLGYGVQAIKPKYFFSTANQTDSTWDLMNYRYFVPVQTRFRDNDTAGHIQESVYSNIALSMSNLFVSRHIQNPDEYNQLLVASHCNKRTNLCYPQSIIAGLGVKTFDNNKVEFVCAFFKENLNTDCSHDIENRIPLNGFFLDNEQILKLVDVYENSASLVCGQTLKFEPSKKGFDGLSSLPAGLIEGVRLLKVESQ